MSTEGWESYLGQVKPLNIEPQVISDGKYYLFSYFNILHRFHHIIRPLGSSGGGPF